MDWQSRTGLEKMKTSYKHWIVYLTLLLVLFPLGKLTAQEMSVPVEMQVRLFTKILAYDRALHPGSDSLTLGVLYQPKFIASRSAKDQFLEALSEIETDGLGPIRCVPIDVTDPETIESAITGEAIDVLYISPLRAADPETLTKISRTHDILTLTGVPEYVESTVSVGIGSKGGRPRILINQEAAREEGADFSAQLLRLAQLIN